MKTESLSAKARSMIEELILEGHLVGKATERDLAQRLHMSRAPIREAMRELINVGLLERQGPKTIIVREMKISEIEEIYQIRKILEAHATSIAASKMTTHHFERLQELHTQMISAAHEENYDLYYEYNISFHQTIHEAADSPRVTALIKQVMKESMLFRSRGLVDQENLQKSIKEHEQLLGAFADKDEELAKLFMTRHIEGGLNRLHLRDSHSN